MECRRNLLTREWVVYGPEIITPEEYIRQALSAGNSSDLFPDSSGACPYCRENMPANHIDIFSVKEKDMPVGSFPVESRLQAADWDVKVIPSPRPIFQIETQLQRFPRRLHDVMEAPGAHEKIILTPEHGVAIWDIPARRIELLFHVLRHRMLNLYRDTRLGHQHAYMVFGKDYGSIYHHTVLNLTASPFVPIKIQRELDGAFGWFKMKERCIFSDIFEEEIIKRDARKPHGIIFESVNFIAIIPFFAGHPFETWIMPLDHHSDFTQTPVERIPELSRVTARIINALKTALGPFPFLLSVMNQPNETWGGERGYWSTIHQDWLWRLRIIPDLPVKNSPLKAFHTGTGVRLNPILPETAAAYIRSLI